MLRPIGWPTLPVHVMAFAPDNQSLLARQLSEPQPRLIAEMDDACLAKGSLKRAS
jgi:hypothetical protein